jgi:hypothetical protein
MSISKCGDATIIVESAALSIMNKSYAVASPKALYVCGEHGCSDFMLVIWTCLCDIGILQGNRSISHFVLTRSPAPGRAAEPGLLEADDAVVNDSA